MVRLGVVGSGVRLALRLDLKHSAGAERSIQSSFTHRQTPERTHGHADVVIVTYVRHMETTAHHSRNRGGAVGQEEEEETCFG